MTTELFTYDEETYPNFFSCCIIRNSDKAVWTFEISERRNDSQQIVNMVTAIRDMGGAMVGFNNEGFDYPVLHLLLQKGWATAPELYQKAQSIIDSDSEFANIVWPDQRVVRQIDLFKMYHFDNNAKRTSLKAIEFARRSLNIEDLPFPPGTVLTHDQMDVTLRYNYNDTIETDAFLAEPQTREMIAFREELNQQYPDRDWINFNDTKIGKQTFIMRLEEAGIPCYEMVNGRRQPRQTPRPSIRLADAILPWIRFENPEFHRVHQWLLNQTITETKGVFKDLTAKVGGIDFVFGLGGIHASVNNQAITSTDTRMLVDIDVESYYPSTAIAQGFYPEHLGEGFADIYADLKRQRKTFGKKTAQNAMLKLALNGVYGDSNNKYSPFYDPMMTMRITLNGQLLLCLLTEWLIARVPGLQMIQANTDGLTVYIPRDSYDAMKETVAGWELVANLTMEYSEYERMFIRDVNSYIAVKTDGSIKRIGAYAYETPRENPSTREVQWHKNHSQLVVPKAAEAALVHGVPVEQFIRNHPDMMDFMCLAKVPRSSRLVLNYQEVASTGPDLPLQNTTRYYVSTKGGALTKIMPPLVKNPDKERRIGICVGWNVTPCNNINDAVDPIDYDYYINEANKLVGVFK